jgi:hypothetical protein
VAVAAAPAVLVLRRLPAAFTAGFASGITSLPHLPNAIRSTPQQAPPARPTNRPLVASSTQLFSAPLASGLNYSSAPARRKRKVAQVQFTLKNEGLAPQVAMIETSRKQGSAGVVVDYSGLHAIVQNAGRMHQKSQEESMSDVVYVSNVKIERKVGPLRIAHLPGEPQPVIFSVHGAIAEHYKVPPDKIKESHAATIDYVIAGTAG